MKPFNRSALLAISLFASLTCALVFADEHDLSVIHNDTPLFSSPDSSAAPAGKLKMGQRVRSESDADGDLYKLKTKSGKPLWIRASDVKASGYSAENDVETGSSKHQKSESKNDSFTRLTYDVGGSTGNSGGASFYEMHLGIDYYILQWLVWRNAPFYRLPSHSTASFGLDSSLEGHYALDLAPDFKPSLQGGAGYRITNIHENAPFLEGGMGLHIKGLSINASVKYIMHSVVTKGDANEKIYTIGFSGGGSL